MCGRWTQGIRQTQVGIPSRQVEQQTCLYRHLSSRQCPDMALVCQVSLTPAESRLTQGTNPGNRSSACNQRRMGP